MDRRVLVVTEPSWMTRLEVTAQVEEEFRLEGLDTADMVLTQAPLGIDNWLGKVISILLLAPKGFERLKVKL